MEAKRAGRVKAEVAAEKQEVCLYVCAHAVLSRTCAHAAMGDEVNADADARWRNSDATSWKL